MKESYIKFKCGCIIPARVRRYISNAELGIKRNFVCANHFQPGDKFVFVCECGIHEICPSMGSLARKKRCRSCAEKTTIDLKRRIYERTLDCHTIHFKCGCSLIKREANKHRVSNSYVCQKHGKYFSKVTATCSECGEVFRLKNTSQVTVRCNRCRASRVDTSPYVDMGYDHACVAHADCKFRDKCLMEYPMGLPCGKCNRYVSAPLDIMDYVFSGDSMGSAGRTHHGKEWRGDRL